MMIIMIHDNHENGQVVFPLYYLEVFILGWLLIEFLLRLWSAGIAFIIVVVVIIIVAIVIPSIVIIIISFSCSQQDIKFNIWFLDFTCNCRRQYYRNVFPLQTNLVILILIINYMLIITQDASRSTTV